MNLWKNEQGLALILVMMFLFLLFSLGMYFLDFSLTEKNIASSQKWGARTYHLAEAGVNEMVWKIKNDDNYNDSFRTDADWSETITRNDPFGEGSGSYTVTVQNYDKGKGEVSATGTIPLAGGNSAQRVIETEVYKTLDSGDEDATTTFDINNSALLAEKKIEISHSDVTIQGTIHSNDSVKATGYGTNVHITKDLEAVDRFSKSFGADVTVDGTISDSRDYSPAPEKLDMPPVSFKESDPDSFKNKADITYTEDEFEDLLESATSSVSFGNASSTKIVYVTGDIVFDEDSDVTLYGALVAEGDIYVGKGSGFQNLSCGGDNTQLSINYVEGEESGLIARDDINFGFCLSSSNIDGVVYAGKKMDIKNFTDSIGINGGIFGRDINIFSVWNEMGMDYNEEIIGNTLYPTQYSPIIKVDHWEEEY